MKLVQQVYFGLGMELSAELERLGKTWNKKNRAQRSMAPSSEAACDMTYYRAENRRFSRFVNGFMIDMIHNWGERSEFFSCVHFGVGQGHGLAYVVEAVNCGFVPDVYDVSSVALNNGRKVLKNQESLNPYFDNMFHLGEMEHVCNSKEFSEKPRLVQASRVVQHMEPAKMFACLKALGKVFEHEASRVVFVHPFGSDNKHVNWVTTFPHSKEDMLSALQAGSSRALEVVRLETCPYFGQVYSAWTVAPVA